MITKQFIRVSLLSALLVLYLAGGCLLITGTYVINFFISNVDVHGSSDLSYFSVDLTQNKTWKDHKDKIKNIDNVGFRLWVTNNGTSVATGELFATTNSTIYTDTTDVRQNATQVFGGLVLPPGKTYVDWPTSLKYIMNLPTMRIYVEGGTFTVYALTSTLPFNITIDSAEVIVTATAGI
jgi:hypothetical protein